MNEADPLLAILQHRHEPELKDDGFSQRVFDALPRARFRTGWMRRIVLGAGAVVGGLLTAFLAPPLEKLLGPEPWLAPPLTPVLAVTLLAALAACAAWAFVSVDFRGMKTP